MKTNTSITRASHLELTAIRAVDGDTLDAQIVLPLGITVRRRIRLKGFAAPEHHGPNPDSARAAQDRLQRACNAGVCWIQTYGSREDRYGRLAAVLWIDGKPVDGPSILGPLHLSDAAHRDEVRRASACPI